MRSVHCERRRHCACLCVSVSDRFARAIHCVQLPIPSLAVLVVCPARASSPIGSGRGGRSRSARWPPLEPSAAVVREATVRSATALAQPTESWNDRGKRKQRELAWCNRAIERSINVAFSRRTQSGIWPLCFSVRSVDHASLSSARVSSPISVHPHIRVRIVSRSSSSPTPLLSPPLSAMATTAAVDKEIEHLVEFVKVLGQ